MNVSKQLILVIAGALIAVVAASPKQTDADPSPPKPAEKKIRVKVVVNSPIEFFQVFFRGKLWMSLRRLPNVEIVHKDEDVLVDCVVAWDGKHNGVLACWSQERMNLVEAAKPMLDAQTYAKWSDDAFGKHRIGEGAETHFAKTFADASGTQAAADEVIDALAGTTLNSAERRLMGK